MTRPGARCARREKQRQNVAPGVVGAHGMRHENDPSGRSAAAARRAVSGSLGMYVRVPVMKFLIGGQFRRGDDDATRTRRTESRLRRSRFMNPSTGFTDDRFVNKWPNLKRPIRIFGAPRCNP